MRIRRVLTALAGCAIAVLAGSPPATADAEPPTCSSEPSTTKPVDVGYHDQWTYTYTVSWCVEGGKIVWALPEVTHQEHGATCTWAGRMEEALTRGSESWTVFDMSEYTCVRGDGSAQGVNPWAEVTIYPNGDYAVRKGVAE